MSLRRIALVALAVAGRWASASAGEPPVAPLVWDGLDPFGPPATTSRFYGSGDVDRDGELSAGDVAWAEEIVAGSRPARIEADADGDGDVDSADVAALQGALGGADLPAWWSRLASRAEREAWIERFLARDGTDAVPYTYRHQCLDFALQLVVRGAVYRGDLHSTELDGGGTAFDLPVYLVSLSWPGGGHAINAVLVGDDPLDFDDWLFLEPQLDWVVRPGDYWLFPFGSEVRIVAVRHLRQGAAYTEPRLAFQVEMSGWSLLEHEPGLVLSRPPPATDPVDNRIDVWNPMLVPGRDALLYERARDDATRASALHVQTPVAAPDAADPELSAALTSRHLLDVVRDELGTVHVLWIGRTDEIAGVFYGRLGAASQAIHDRVRVSGDGARVVRAGRIVVTAAGKKHVFWLEDKRNISHPYPTGIYWSMRTETGWTPPLLVSAPLVPDFGLLDLSDWWEHRDALRSFFDVVSLGGERLLLAWNHPTTPESTTHELRIRVLDGVWGSTRSLGATGSGGVALGSAGDRLALAHTLDTEPLARRGRLVERVSTDGGAHWSAARSIDPGGTACCPRAASSSGKLALAWDRGGVAAWRRWSGAGWTPIREIGLPPGAEAWYPDLAWRGGSLSAAWSERWPDRAAIGTALLVLFTDGFESGDLRDWSLATPAASR